MEKREKIIIDTDIGDDIDDAYALALAVRMKKFDILGVTTVFRNSMQRAKIASALLGALGEETDVYAGEDYPYKAAFQVEDFEERLPDGRPVIPHYFPEFASAPVRSLSAVDFIAEQAEKAPGEVTLMAIGPLTNLAKTAEKYPNSFRKFSRIICMGGSFTGEKAEWNIRCDPEAAALVLRAGVPMTFVGIDVTAYTYLEETEVRAVTSGRGREFGILGRMLGKWRNTHPGRRPTMHDALTIAEATEKFCTYGRRRIDIPLAGDERARTRFTDTPSAAEVTYATGLDRTAFLRFFINTLKSGEAPYIKYFKDAGQSVFPEGGKE